MKRDKREVVVAVAPGLALALVGVGLAGLVAATLVPPEREAVMQLLAPRVALLLLGWLVLAVALGMLARRAYAVWVAAPARLAEAVQSLVSEGSAHTVELPARVSCGAGARALAEAANVLAQQRERLQADVDSQVREAARGIEQERSRLGALMAELTQSVVVCNLDGRILLYNRSARMQFRALSHAPTLADGTELIGLGRSVYAVFDRRLVAHAIESIEQLMRRGAEQPSAQFVTSSRSGQLLRVQMAPVCDPPVVPQAPRLSGFVLMLHNITREFEQDSEQDRLLLGLTEGTRASLGNLQAAVEMLELPDLEAPMRERFLRVVRDEVGAMTARVRALAASSSEGVKTRWPLEDMLGADLVHAALRAIETLPNLRAAQADVDESLWMKVDSFALIQAVASLAARLADEFGVKRVLLRLQREGTRAQLDLIWPGTALSTETAMNWEASPITVGQEATPLSVRDVVERHGGEFWFQRDRVRHEAFFRFLLPLAEPEAAVTPPQSGSRGTYYDFDLFRPSVLARELDDRRLADLSYTAFDTETTGLDPSQGDEIIQIGAVRIINGKLLHQETYEQLIDPGRSIPRASIAIHGIEPGMVLGCPTIEEVLPVFHAFANDTVLIAHNAAFDMRFLQLKEASTGVCFDQPVLDTLLLSAVVSPNQESHELEAIAQRLGVAVVGRHTALGDAVLAAEVFLRLVPLLAARGIDTLGQARVAAQQTWFASLKY